MQQGPAMLPVHCAVTITIFNTTCALRRHNYQF